MLKIFFSRLDAHKVLLQAAHREVGQIQIAGDALGALDANC